MDRVIDRILCSNLAGEVRPYPASKLYRHSIFNSDAHIVWPPENWRQLHCWNCCHALEAPPVPLATDFERRTGAYRVYGIFCDFPCAKRYLLEHVSWTAGDKLLLLDELAHDVFQCSEVIGPSPPRQRLKIFGGDMDIAEFRARNQARVMALLHPPLISLPEVYEHVDQEDFARGRGRNTTAPWSVGRLKKTLPAWTAAPLSSEPTGEGLYAQFLTSNPMPQEEPGLDVALAERLERTTRAKAKAGDKHFVQGAKKPPTQTGWKMQQRDTHAQGAASSSSGTVGTLAMFMKKQ